MTDAERRALITQILTTQERALRLFRRLRDATPHDHPGHTAVFAADRAQIAAWHETTIQIGQER